MEIFDLENNEKNKNLIDLDQLIPDDNMDKEKDEQETEVKDKEENDDKKEKLVNQSKILENIFYQITKRKLVYTLKYKHDIVQFIANLIQNKLKTEIPQQLTDKVLQKYNTKSKLTKYIMIQIQEHFPFFDEENELHKILIPITNIMLKILYPPRTLSLFESINVDWNVNEPNTYSERLKLLNTNAINDIINFVEQPCNKSNSSTIYLISNPQTIKVLFSFSNYLKTTSMDKQIKQLSDLQKRLIPQLELQKTIGNAAKFKQSLQVQPILDSEYEIKSFAAETETFKESVFVVNNLRPKTKYTIKTRTQIPIYGQDPVWTTYSEDVLFTTLDIVTPTIAIKKLKFGSIIVEVKPRLDIIGYKFNCDTQSICKKRHQCEQFKNPIRSINELEPATDYSLQVKAKFDSKLWSNYSMKLFFKTISLADIFNAITKQYIPKLFKQSKNKNQQPIICFISNFLHSFLDCKGFLNPEKHLNDKDTKEIIDYIQRKVNENNLIQRIKEFVDFLMLVSKLCKQEYMDILIEINEKYWIGKNYFNKQMTEIIKFLLQQLYESHNETIKQTLPAEKQTFYLTTQILHKTQREEVITRYNEIAYGYNVTKKAKELTNELEKEFKQIDSEYDTFYKKSEDTINSINFDQQTGVEIPKYNWDDIANYKELNEINTLQQKNKKTQDKNKDHHTILQQSVNILDEETKIDPDLINTEQVKQFMSKIDAIQKHFDDICDIGNQLSGLNTTIDDFKVNTKQLAATRSELKIDETADEEKTLQTFRNELEKIMKENNTLKRSLNKGLDAVDFIEIVYKNQKLIDSHSKLIDLSKQECKFNELKSQIKDHNIAQQKYWPLITQQNQKIIDIKQKNAKKIKEIVQRLNETIAKINENKKTLDVNLNTIKTQKESVSETQSSLEKNINSLKDDINAFKKERERKRKARANTLKNELIKDANDIIKQCEQTSKKMQSEKGKLKTKADSIYNQIKRKFLKTDLDSIQECKKDNGYGKLTSKKGECDTEYKSTQENFTYESNRATTTIRNKIRSTKMSNYAKIGQVKTKLEQLTKFKDELQTKLNKLKTNERYLKKDPYEFYKTDDMNRQRDSINNLLNELDELNVQRNGCKNQLLPNIEAMDLLPFVTNPDNIKKSDDEIKKLVRKEPGGLDEIKQGIDDINVEQDNKIKQVTDDIKDFETAKDEKNTKQEQETKNLKLTVAQFEAMEKNIDEFNTLNKTIKEDIKKIAADISQAEAEIEVEDDARMRRERQEKEQAEIKRKQEEAEQAIQKVFKAFKFTPVSTVTTTKKGGCFGSQNFCHRKSNGKVEKCMISEIKIGDE
eukprot:113882_1